MKILIIRLNEWSHCKRTDFTNVLGLKEKVLTFHMKFIHWLENSDWFALLLELSKKFIPTDSHWTSGNKKLEFPTELASTEPKPVSTLSKILLLSISLNSFMSSIFLLISSLDKFSFESVNSLSNHSGSCLMLSWDNSLPLSGLAWGL